MKKISKTKLAWIIIFVFFAFIFIMGMIKRKDSPVVTHTETVYNNEYDGSVSQVEHYLKEHLKDPSSYESVKWFQVVEVNGAIDEYPQAKYSVRHTYRAKNSFGALDLETSIFFLNSSGVVLGMKKM